MADVAGTDLLPGQIMALTARALALTGEAVFLITDRGLVPANDWDVSTRDGTPRAYRLSLPDGPPPFSGMNSTPAASSAGLIAATEGPATARRSRSKSTTVERLTLAALMLAGDVAQLRSFDCPPICFLPDKAQAELHRLMSLVGD